MTGKASVTNLLIRWRQLPAEDRRAQWPALWRLSYVRLNLALRGWENTRKSLARRKPAGARHLEHPQAWQSRMRALQRASRRMPHTHCLARSLTLWWWMRGAGLDPQLRMGVRRSADDLEGHAWVECDAHLFDETPQGAARWSQMRLPTSPGSP